MCNPSSTIVISETEKKLREAHFFLQKLEQEAMPIGNINPEHASFYLSAFLSAARSVTFVMQAEHPDKYPGWIPKWRENKSTREQQLMARFVDARNRSQKRQTHSLEEDLDPRTISPFGGSNIPPELTFFFTETWGPPSVVRDLKVRLMPETKKEYLLPICREYVELLSDLVRDFKNDL